MKRDEATRFKLDYLPLQPAMQRMAEHLLGSDLLGIFHGVRFFTEVTLPLRRGHPYVEDEGLLAEPIIGLQYRHRFSSHWYFDASAAYAWNRHAPTSA